MTDPQILLYLNHGLPAARDVMATLLGPSAASLAGILSDQADHWRLRNKVRLLLKTRDVLQANGIQPEKVLPDVFVPLVEAASNVEAEELADMFASLLAAHLDPATQDGVHPAFAKVLAQMAPCDAAAVSVVHELVLARGDLVTPIVVRPKTVADRGVSSELAMAITENLERLGIVRRRTPDILPPEEHHEPFDVTRFGEAFAHACHHGRGPGPTV